jgi:hypothetical protein
MLPEESAELEQALKEATSEVEKALSLEDKGWIKFGISDVTLDLGSTRSDIVKRSRRYYMLDPLARQAIRLWTDYTFGSGLSFQAEDENTQEVATAFWNSPANRCLTTSQGQRKSCDKLLVDGEVFFALFLGASGEVTIRRIDPLEITEIITDPDDIESVMFYKREWTNQQLVRKISYYCSVQNSAGESVKDSMGKEIQKTEDALVYHLAFNSIGQRGNPLLLPVMDWVDEYRRFLASRIAIVRALARFAWKNKVMGGATAIAAAKAVTGGKYPQAASTWLENQGSNLDPIKTDTGAANAKDDGRMIKLQICAGLGIPEQYFGDISTGNLATAKTVELPLLKQFQSYQQLWSDAYTDILNIVFGHSDINPDKRFVDIDFPEIAPSDAQAALTAISQLVMAFPDLADSPDVKRQALINIGLNNVDEVLANLVKEAKAGGSSQIRLIKALKEFKEEMVKSNAMS